MILQRLLCCILFISIKASPAFAVTFIEDGAQLGKSVFQIGTAPRHWTAKSWLSAGLIGSSAYLLYKNKEHDRSFFKVKRLNQKTNEYEIYPKTLFEKSYFNLMELPQSYIVYATAGSYIIGQILDVKPVRNASFELLQSMGISQALAVLGAYVFAEKRPSEGGKLRHFKWGGARCFGTQYVLCELKWPPKQIFNHHSKF